MKKKTLFSLYKQLMEQIKSDKELKIYIIQKILPHFDPQCKSGHLCFTPLAVIEN